MLWLVWIALAFCVVAFVVGAVHAVREGLAFWRDLRGFTAFVGHATEVVGRLADDASQKAAGAAERLDRLTGALERLQRSLAYAQVIGGAGGRTLAAYAALRNAVPRK